MQPAIPPEEDDDCDIDLEEQISSYTESELKQVEQLTLEVHTHWNHILATNGATMSEDTRAVIESCIQHAEEDLKIIRIKMKSFSAPSDGTNNTNGEVSDSS